MKPARRTSRGFTLVEVVISLALISIVLLATQSAILIVARVAPDSQKGSGALIAGTGAFDSMADDVASATAFATMTPTDIKFTVPDRDGDAAVDTIRYVWSGTAGAPLQRQFNAGALVNVLPSVNSFALSYDKIAMAAPYVYTTAAEASVSSFTTATNLQDATVKSNSWYAQYVNPSTIPATAQSWSITRIVFNGSRASGNSGQTKIQVRLANGYLPTTRVLGEVLVYESALGGGYAPVTVNFTNVNGLIPGQGVCIVFQWVTASDSMQAQFANGLTTAHPLSKSTDSGSSWNAVTDSRFLMTVYGAITTPTSTTQYVLNGVRADMQVGSNAATLGGGFPVFNHPVVTGP